MGERIERERHTNKQADRPTHEQNSQADRIDRKTHRHRQTDRQTQRQTDTQA